MQVWKRKPRLVVLAVACALLASLTLVTASGQATVEQEMLTNGDFEGGFAFVQGCGNVGSGWGCFNNGGSIHYGFYDDQWPVVLAAGHHHSQLVELSTVGQGASENDRFAGIYQPVSLVGGAQYQFRIQGLMREQNPDARDDPFRYRVQWGYAVGTTDWSQVTNWVELPWDNIYDRLNPGALQSYSATMTAPADNVTIFIRVWKKWGTTQKEINVNLGPISLWGPQVRHACVGCKPNPCAEKACQPQAAPQPAPQSSPCAQPACGPASQTQVPTQAAGVACTGPNLVQNGDFEGGFIRVAGWGDIGNGWLAFHNGGGANYGYYDEQWTPVVHSAAHGQLLEINSRGVSAADADRFSGIAQVVTGLTPGATYQFALYGEMREEAAHPGEDVYRYRVQWGYAPAGSSADLSAITNWTELPWDTIHLRTAPGGMSFYSTQIVAPSRAVVLAVRAWKKWPTLDRELDVNLDDISLQACANVLPPPPPPPVPGKGQCATYTVKRGDTLRAIAAAFGEPMRKIVTRNKIANPNLIRVGQKLTVCGVK